MPNQFTPDEKPRYNQDGNSLYGSEGRYSDRLGDHIQPREGFAYPEHGAKITALKEFNIGAGAARIRQGDIGTVIGCRKPFTFDKERGYMGLIAQFPSIKKTYPEGVVLAWDFASDETIFQIDYTPKPA